MATFEAMVQDGFRGDNLSDREGCSVNEKELKEEVVVAFAEAALPWSCSLPVAEKVSTLLSFFPDLQCCIRRKVVVGQKLALITTWKVKRRNIAAESSSQVGCFLLNTTIYLEFSKGEVVRRWAQVDLDSLQREAGYCGRPQVNNPFLSSISYLGL